jgi:catalase
MIRYAWTRYLVAAAVSPCMLSGVTPVHAAAADSASSVRPVEVVDSLEQTFGVHPGQRRNHTKGTCAVGEFVGTPAAAALSRSALFSGTAIEVVARFSVAGGNPHASDATKNARGMALEFRLPDGSRQHMTMLNTPVFGAANPGTFNDMLIASRPDPKTGKPDPKKLREFLASHPDALAQSQFLMENNPPQSYATATYYSIHTFEFIDRAGELRPVKWRFVPGDGEKELTADEMSGAPKDFLEQRLIERVSKAPATWDMLVYEGEIGDSLDNATIAWPETRKHFVAGTLNIRHAMPQTGAACEKINFDPLVMSDGIAPTSDPVLLFRSPAYAVSLVRRLSGR